MDTKLTTVNLYLARVVFAVACFYAIAATLLATITGEMLLLGGTAFGLAAGGYAMQVANQPSTQTLRVRSERESVAA